MTGRSRAVVMRLAAAVTVVLSTMVTPVIHSRAYATTVPFRDEYQNGSLTLCGRDGRPVTSGNLLTVPFVWSAVSTTAAPSGYSRAELVLYQPIQYVDAGNWSGDPLTVAALFSTPDHPAAQATNADVPLLYADRQYPPHWNGLFELRMYFLAPNRPVYSASYPAAVIQIRGNNWYLVQGGGVPCSAGHAVALETLYLPKSELATPQTVALVPQSQLGQSNAKTGSNSAHGAKRSARQASGSSSAAAGQRGSQTSGGGSGFPVLATVASVLAAGALGGALIWRIRRRGHPSTRVG